jgi:nitroreductase
MELREAIRQRRSIRRYTDAPVAKELLERLLEDACWAPSAENYQPWHFVALTKPEEIALLSESLQKSTDELQGVLEQRFPNHPQTVQETTAFIRTLGGAPVCILAFLRQPYSHRDSVYASVAAAVENLLLSACDAGLGACWIGAVSGWGNGAAVEERFGPEGSELVAMISLGYPAHQPNPPRRKSGRWEIR